MILTETTTIDFDSYELISVTDFAPEKNAVARIKLLKNGEFIAEQLLTLWEGNDYDKAGQFTDTDISNKINNLIK